MNTSAPFVTGSETSRAAAISIEPCQARIRNMVLAWIRAAGENGLSCDELEEFSAMKHQTVSARLVELRNRKEIEPLVDGEGKAVTRRTRSGRGTTVYIAKY
jgi:predicted transcriptional regulator